MGLWPENGAKSRNAARVSPLGIHCQGQKTLLKTSSLMIMVSQNISSKSAIFGEILKIIFNSIDVIEGSRTQNICLFSISAHCVPDAPTNREIEDEGIAIGEPNATLNTDASKFRHLRDKLQQWNSDLKKRRNSQVCCCRI